MKIPTIIGLTGYAGTGKDTVRELLCTHHGFEGMAFADPIRMMLRELLLSNGITDAWMQDRQLKEAVIPALGVSYRHMAQTLGTEWGRSLHPDFWTRTAGAYIDDAHQHPDTSNASFVVSDVRFANEAQWVRERGGVIWRVERSAAVPVRAHASEAEIYHIHADRVIDNNGDFAALGAVVAEALGA